MKILYELSWLWETLGIALAAAAVCVCRTDLQGGKEEAQQKRVGSHRSCGVCGRYFGGHFDRPDTDAALMERA